MFAVAEESIMLYIEHTCYDKSTMFLIKMYRKLNCLTTEVCFFPFRTTLTDGMFFF